MAALVPPVVAGIVFTVVTVLIMVTVLMMVTAAIVVTVVIMVTVAIVVTVVIMVTMVTVSMAVMVPAGVFARDQGAVQVLRDQLCRIEAGRAHHDCQAGALEGVAHARSHPAGDHDFGAVLLHEPGQSRVVVRRRRERLAAGDLLGLGIGIDEREGRGAAEVGVEATVWANRESEAHVDTPFTGDDGGGLLWQAGGSGSPRGAPYPRRRRARG